jgi:hypothetical protein
MNRVQPDFDLPAARVVGMLLLVASLPCSAQTVVGSARVLCAPNRGWITSGPIVGAIINQTNTTISDVEMELSIITRDKRGILKRRRDTRFVVVPSLNQNGMVTELQPNADVYFSVPGKTGFDNREGDGTCGREDGTDSNSILNVAAIFITRINGKSLLPGGLKQAPLESMLQVPRYSPKPDYVPTERDVIQAIRQRNELFEETIINRQLKDCLSQDTWACTFNNDTNINVVISQR